MNYRQLYHPNEVEQSRYNFEVSDPKRLEQLFDIYKAEFENCIEQGLVLPAYDYVLKCSHTFNLLDARGVVSRDERMNYVLRIRKMAEMVAKRYVESREAMGFPLLKQPELV